MIGIARRRMVRYSIALPNGIDAGKGDSGTRGVEKGDIGIATVFRGPAFYVLSQRYGHRIQ